MSKKTAIPPRSDAQGKIIKLLMKKNRMTFTEIQRWLNLSRPAVSRHLATLCNDNTIEFEKKGREKFYKIKNITSKHIERNFDIVSAIYEEYFGYQLYKTKHDDFTEFIEFVNRKLNAYFFFTIIKSFETGKDWSPVFDSKSMLDLTADFATYMILQISSKQTDEEIEEIREPKGPIGNNESYSKFNKVVKTDKRYKENLKKFKYILKQRYPEEIEVLEKQRHIYRKNEF